MGFEGPQCGPIELMCLSFCLSIYPYISVSLFISLSGRPRYFLANIRTDRNCEQRMRPQATWSNPLSGSIIYPYVSLSGHVRAF